MIQRGAEEKAAPQEFGEDAGVILLLATFCWTKSILCNDAYYTGMLLYSESTLQFLASKKTMCRIQSS
jgi:hypothetical protein